MLTIIFVTMSKIILRFKILEVLIQWKKSIWRLQKMMNITWQKGHVRCRLYKEVRNPMGKKIFHNVLRAHQSFIFYFSGFNWDPKIVQKCFKKKKKTHFRKPPQYQDLDSWRYYLCIYLLLFYLVFLIIIGCKKNNHLIPTWFHSSLLYLLRIYLYDMNLTWAKSMHKGIPIKILID